MPRDLGDCYIQQGDIYIGLLMSIKETGENEFCGDDLKDIYRPQIAEAFVYAIEEVNRDADILPNITVGFVVLDTCYRDLAALGQTMHLLPIKLSEGSLYFIWKHIV